MKFYKEDISERKNKESADDPTRVTDDAYWICFDGLRILKIKFFTEVPYEILYDRDGIKNLDAKTLDVTDSMDKKDRRIKTLMRNIMDQIYSFENYG